MSGARVAVERALPRGRHGLPKGEIVAHQRDRLLRAVAVEIRDQGYSSLSVADVVARAGVSRRTFYQLFEDKLDCVLAAHRAAASRLEWLISEAYATAADGPSGAAAAVATVLRQAARSPEDLHLALIANGSISEPAFAPLGVAVRNRLVTALETLQPPDRRPPAPISAQAAVEAAIGVVVATLAAGEAESLPDFTPEVIRLILAPYIGAEEAKRIASAA